MKKLLVVTLLYNILANPLLGMNSQHRIDSIKSRIVFYENHDSLTRAIYCLMDLGNEYENSGNWDEYDKVVEKMFSYSEKTKDRGYLSECYNKVGIACCLRGKNKEAISYFKEGMKISFELADTDRFANFHENIGLVYKDLGEFQLALEHQTECLKIRELNPMHPRLPNSYSNISQLWGYMEDTAKQWQYLKLAVKVNETLEIDHSRSAVLCCEVGEYLLNSKKYDDALKYFTEGLEHCKTIGWKRGISVFIGDIACIYDAKEEWRKSLDMHLQSLGFAIEIDDCQSTSQEYNSIANCYYQLNKLDSAAESIILSLNKTVGCGLQSEFRDAALLASKIYEKKGDYVLALDYHKQYHATNDSLIGIAKQNSMSELEAKYETEKKEQQITLLSKDNQVKKQRNALLLVTTISLILIIAVGFLLYIRRKIQNQQKQDSLQQQLLRSQMNPHFLFNALGSIQNYMIKNDGKSASRYLSSFASLTRSVLDFSAVEKISLSDEINYLQNYLELEQLRMNHCFEFKINFDEDLETEFIKIPPMFIQPFVENAVKHGIKDMEGGGMIELHIAEEQRHILFTLNDNGKGMQKKSDNGHKSMAMKIFEERKKLIEKKLKKSIYYKVKSPSLFGDKPHGTQISIGLPF